MKKILIIASLALCCSLLASCEDFLDTKKYGAKTDWELSLIHISEPTRH